MGVDVCLTPGDPIRAIGNGIVAGIMRNWYAGQPYIWYQLTGGPQAGQYVYVAEQIDHLARIGQSLQAGDVIARYAKSGSCLETGWSMADGETQAEASTGYTDGQVTPAGVSFARFLLTLGVTGQFELSAPQTQPNRASTTKRHRRHRATPVPVATPAPGAHAGPGAQAQAQAGAQAHARAPADPRTQAGTEAQAGAGADVRACTRTGARIPGPNFGPGTEPYWPAPH